MFLARCEKQGRATIIWDSEVIGLESSAEGIIRMRYRCGCGSIAETMFGTAIETPVTFHPDFDAA